MTDYKKRIEDRRQAIADIFYKAGLEHLIQSEPQPDGQLFCETCQDMATPNCYALNAMLTVANQDIRKLLHQAEADSYANALYDVGYGFAPIKEIDSVEEKLAAFTYREES